jgi:pSer/pThr/pTyr-binding forkhead associated (FHA) protein
MNALQTEITLRYEGEELARVVLEPGEYVVGRSAEAEIHVETPLLSRKHALLTIHPDYLALEDLGSSNGTFVNDRAISESTRLFPNHQIRLGDIHLEVRRQRTATASGSLSAPAQETIRRLLPDELLTNTR